MINYLLLALSIAFATANNLLFHKMGEICGKDGKTSKYNSFAFTALQSAVWLIFLVPTMSVSRINTVETVFGSVFGLSQVMFLMFKLKAMSTGPVSVTSVMSNMSMLLSTLVGIIIFNETPSAVQILGVALVVASVLMCTLKKGGVEAQKSWKFWCVGYFLLAAAMGCIQKIFAKFDGQTTKLLAVASVWMIVLSCVFAVVTAASGKNDKGLSGIIKGFGITRLHFVFAVVCGICTVGYNMLNLVLAAELPSVMFFPVFNGSIVLLCAVLGVVFFKERLTKTQMAGVALGIAAVVCIGMG